MRQPIRGKTDNLANNPLRTVNARQFNDFTRQRKAVQGPPGVVIVHEERSDCFHPQFVASICVDFLTTPATLLIAATQALTPVSLKRERNSMTMLCGVDIFCYN